jgi:G3E family GTPase
MATQLVEKVGVLIVSGFLGSGKTTLVRRILEDAQARGIRVGIVSNEFGELGIDQALLGGGEQRFVELAGGCVCCELSDELIETLQAMREKVNPERIVIETSGVALPFETQLNLYRPPIDRWVGDEAVVVVVDAAQLREGPAAPETFENQVSGADLLVLHKVDLVEEEALPGLEATLNEMNPGCPVLRASFGRVPTELLFPTGPRVIPPEAYDHDHRHHRHHHEAFFSEELAAPADLSPEELLAWLKPRRGLRTKGFVQTTAGIRIVQGVGRRIDLQEPGELNVDPTLLGRVVVIHLPAEGQPLEPGVTKD